MISKKLNLFLIIIGLVFAAYLYMNINLSKPTTQISASPTTEIVNGEEKVKYPQDLVIVLLGDSMTERLGNSDEIRANLKKYYPQKTVEVLNYGFGSTNILSVPDRLTKTTFFGRDFRPIIEIDYDLILIESFAHNPLSQFPLKEGLQKQSEALDEIVEILKSENPEGKIVFIATLAPNSKNYARTSVELSSEKRKDWADERTAYLKNHIDYANSKKIPLINVYEKSLKNGDGNLDYIDSKDFIHPSPNGIYLISAEIADFIKNNNLMN